MAPNFNPETVVENDLNAKQRLESLHLRVGDLKPDKQGLYPELNATQLEIFANVLKEVS